MADARIELLRMLWGIGGSGTFDVTLEGDPTARDRLASAVQRGHFWSVSPTPTPSQRILADAYAFERGAAGRAPFTIYTTGLQDLDVVSGWAYPGGRTGASIHSVTRAITQGTNVVTLNLAAGGGIQSWTVGGSEILNRGARWSRGIAQQAEWADVATGRLVRHAAHAACSRYDSGVGAQGAILLDVTEEAPPEGGRRVTITTIPIDFDPDGGLSIPGVQTDHGGSDRVMALWRDVRCVTELWLEYAGTAGLHRLRTTWTFPDPLVTYWLDAALSASVCLVTAFDEVQALDASTDTLTDVTAAVDAVDYRRFGVSRAGTFQDDVASPSSASTIASGHGAMIARQTGPDLAVALAARTAEAIGAGTDLVLPATNHGTWWSYLTNRTGTTGQDGAQVVCLGLDAGFTGRWHSHESKRTLPASVQTTRWISIGTLAAVRAQVAGLPS